MHENFETRAYISHIDENVLDKQTEVTDIIWGINDMNIAWADGVKGIESAA